MLPLTPLRRSFAAVAAAAALALAAACADTDDGPDGPDGEPDQVRYLTSFGASAHDVFVFVAEEKGFFEQAGIDITIDLGAGSQNYAPLLAGEAQFSYVDVTSILYSIGQGDLTEDDFVVLSAVHHQTLVAILVPEDVPDVTTPADLEGKTIGAFAGSPTDFLLPAYAAMSGWEYDDSLLTRTSPADLFTGFGSRQFEIASTFIIQKGVFESPNVLDMPTTAFPFNEYLDDLLGTGLIAPRALADDDPDLAIRFRDAALEGLRYTLENPEESIEILQAIHPDAVANVPAFVAQISIMEPYITSEGEDRIGVVDPAHVVRAISSLVGHGLIPGEIDPDAILHEVTLTVGD